MRTLFNTPLALSLVTLFFSPGFAQKVTIENVAATVQPLERGEFQLHFEFALPDFDGASAEKINLDYAVLTFGVHVLVADTAALNMLEMLVAAENRISPKADLDYNKYPVTARVRREKEEMELVEADVTQVIDHWVHRGVANKGLLLVSHRNVDEKTLKEGVIEFALESKPVVTIFYTANE